MTKNKWMPYFMPGELERLDLSKKNQFKRAYDGISADCFDNPEVITPTTTNIYTIGTRITGVCDDYNHYYITENNRRVKWEGVQK